MPAFSTRTHGMLDYVVALVLAAAPWWAGFAGTNSETGVAVVVALAVAGNGLITDHELGVHKKIQMPLHLWIDALSGIVLGSSPWVFSFDQRVWIPHLVIGLLLLVLAISSHTIPGYERRGTARAHAD